MSDYANALQTLSDGATKSTTPTATAVTGKQDWMDAYGQQGQKSWGDYYKKYKDQFSGDQATGYAAATQGSNNNNNVGLQYLLNTQQRQIDGRMDEYQDWMKNYWTQQAQGQQQLLDYLKQHGGDAPETQRPAPEKQNYIINDTTYQNMHNIYKGDGEGYWGNPNDASHGQLRSSVEESLQHLRTANVAQRKETADWLMKEYGVTFDQWAAQIHHLDRLLTNSGWPGQQQQPPPPQQQQQPPPPQQQQQPPPQQQQQPSTQHGSTTAPAAGAPTRIYNDQGNLNRFWHEGPSGGRWLTFPGGG